MHYDTINHNDVNKYINDIPAAEDDAVMDVPFKREEVMNVLKIIKLNAMGPDGVSPHFLKHAPEELGEVLVRLFNYSWCNHVLPVEWRQANVCVLHKKGTRVDDISSYRPISLTSVVVKSFERLVLHRMMDRVKDKLVNTQAGFRPRHACTDQIYQLLHAIKSWHHNHDNQVGNPFYAAFIDFSKAFDRVWTNGLLSKVHRMGIRGRAWRWIQSFLTGRSLRVINGSSYSDWYDITAGVPQGSVISPLLFIIFINDFADHILKQTHGAHCLKFADDIVMWSVLQSPHGIRQCIEAALKWCHLWKMVINSLKSNIVPFTTGSMKWDDLSRFDEFQPMAIEQKYPNDSNKQRITPLTFTFTDTYKYLGVTLHHHLNWSTHATSVIKKANRACALVCRLIHPKGRQSPGIITIRLLTRMIIYTTIGYGLPLWTMTKQQQRKLQSLIVRPLLSEGEC